MSCQSTDRCCATCVKWFSPTDLDKVDMVVGVHTIDGMGGKTIIGKCTHHRHPIDRSLFHTSMDSVCGSWEEFNNHWSMVVGGDK